MRFEEQQNMNFIFNLLSGNQTDEQQILLVLLAGYEKDDHHPRGKSLVQITFLLQFY